MHEPKAELTVVVVYPQLERIERLLRAVFRQNDEMLDLLAEGQPDPGKVAAITARVKTIRTALAEAVQDATPTDSP